MRLTIRHHTEYRYDRAVPYALQRLRLVPRNDAAQTVSSWTLDITGGLVEARYVDGYGNETWLVSARDGTDHLSIEAAGVIETRDTSGVLGINRGPAPLWLYVGPTALAEPDEAIRALAAETGGRGDLDCLHKLMHMIADRIVYEPGRTSAVTTAAEALAGGHGVCQDHAHVFCAAARTMAVPARYVSGYLYMDGTEQQVASHAWAEAHVDGLGWVGFDCANRVCPDERYVRIAHGRDYTEASPVSGIRFGHAEETLAVNINVAQ